MGLGERAPERGEQGLALPSVTPGLGPLQRHLLTEVPSQTEVPKRRVLLKPVAQHLGSTGEQEGSKKP